MINRFKFEGKLGWVPILGRVITGWMQHNRNYMAQYDIIVINPSHASRVPRHTELLIQAAEWEDVIDEFPWDPGGPWDSTLIKNAVTESATAQGTSWVAKRLAADALGDAVVVSHPERVRGATVLLLDDITTTLLQQNVIAGILRRAGATSVSGLVLARQPWAR